MPLRPRRRAPAVHRRHQRGDERRVGSASARLVWRASSAEHGHLPTDELRERILREIDAFVAGAPQHDDMTMILIKFEEFVPGAVAAGFQHGPGLNASASDPSPLAVVFRTHSDIEASIVRGLLEAHGIDAAPSSDLTHAVFPLSIDGLGEVRISVSAVAGRRGRARSSASRASARRQPRGVPRDGRHAGTCPRSRRGWGTGSASPRSSTGRSRTGRARTRMRPGVTDRQRVARVPR